MARQPEVFVRELDSTEMRRLVKITRTTRDRVRLRRPGIVLASASGCRGRHVGHRLTARNQPLRKMAAQPTGVLHRPAALCELLRPAQQPPILRQRRIDAHGPKRPVGARIQRRRRMAGLVRVDPNHDHQTAFLSASDKEAAAGTPTFSL